MRYLKLVLWVSLLMTFMVSCSDNDSGTEPEFSLNSNLVARWEISAKSSRDRNWTGHIEFFNDRSFDWEMTYGDEDQIHSAEGTAYNEGQSLYFNMTNVTGMFEEGQLLMEYLLENNMLNLVGDVSDENLDLDFEKVDDEDPPTGDIDANLIGEWTLEKYEDEDGEQGWSGNLQFNNDGSFSGVFTDDEDLAADSNFLGTAYTENNKIYMNITSATGWVETGEDVWDYSVNGTVLVLEGEVAQENTTLTYINGPLGSVYGVVTEADTGEPAQVNVTLEDYSTYATEIDGSFLFEDVIPGTYNLTVDGLEVYNDETRTVEVGSGEQTEVSMEVTEDTSGSGEINGFVIGFQDIEPHIVEGANINIAELGLSATSDESGYFEIEQVPVGTYDVEASKTGYNSQTMYGVVVVNSVATTLDFTLVSDDIEGVAAIAGTVTDG